MIENCPICKGPVQAGVREETWDFTHEKELRTITAEVPCLVCHEGHIWNTDESEAAQHALECQALGLPKSQG